jgi:ribonuclease E
MLINVSEGEECRIALLEDGRLEELYMERTSSTSHVGNIYKGRVTNVEASIQAAFVDFGLGRNGFLHISDLMPTYFGRKGEEIVETVGKKMARRDRPPIQRCLRRGDEIIVQIIKEGIGTKGPTLSSYLSIPGRYLVMMPGVGKMGVSQKIEDDAERRRLRQILDGLKPPEGVGFIIRTAGVGKTKTEIERDLKYLTRLWEQLERKRQGSKGPTELYAEGDLVTRTVRDFFSADVDRIVVDNAEVAERVRDVIKISTPRAKDRVEVYEDAVPLFHKFGIEREIELMYSRHVPLPSGGSLVIDSTEAIVAIDVNSGKFREHNDAEMTAFKTDMEAADEIPRQLKLRDLGGVIICDFIDLRYERNRRELEKRLHDNFKKDRAKTKVLRMSQFGIIEMTRQRMRASLKRSIYFDCPHCKGAGLVKTPESMSLDVMRRIAIAINDLKVARVELAVCPDVAFYLQNKKRHSIAQLEDHFKKRVIVHSVPGLGLDEMKLELFDARDGLVVLPELDAALSQPGHKSQLHTKPQLLLPNRGGGAATGGRGDGRGGRDQGRRGPQPQQARRDEDDSGMEERFDLEDDEAETAQVPARGDGGGGGDRNQRDDRGQRGPRDDRSPRDNQGRQDRGRDARGPGGRQDPQRAERAGGNGPARQESVDRNRHVDAAAGDEAGHDETFHEAGAPGENGVPGAQGEAGHAEQGGEGEPGEGGRRRRRRRRGRRGRGRGRQSEGQPTLQPGQGPEGQGQLQPAGDSADADLELDRHDHDELDADRDETGHYDNSEPLGDAPQEITDDDEEDVRRDDDRSDAGGFEPIGSQRDERDAVSRAIEDRADDVAFEVDESLTGANDVGEHLAESVEATASDRARVEQPQAAAGPEPDAESDTASVAEQATAETPAKGGGGKSRGRRGGRGRGGRAKAPAQPDAPPVEVEAAPAVPQVEASPAPKPRRRSGGSTTGRASGGTSRSRGRKAPASAAGETDSAGATAEASAGASPQAAAPVVTPAPVRKTGSSDRHLMRDEPVIPDPVRRPRTSRDLDEIPDDLD